MLAEVREDPASVSLLFMGEEKLVSLGQLTYLLCILTFLNSHFAVSRHN